MPRSCLLLRVGGWSAIGNEVLWGDDVDDEKNHVFYDFSEINSSSISKVPVPVPVVHQVYTQYVRYLCDKLVHKQRYTPTPPSTTP